MLFLELVGGQHLHHLCASLEELQDLLPVHLSHLLTPSVAGCEEPTVGTSGGCFVRSGRRTTVCDKTSERITMCDFLLIVILGTVASRLLGIRLSWPRRLIAAFLGVSAGSVIAFLLSGRRPPQNPADSHGPPPAIWGPWLMSAGVCGGRHP